MSIFSYYQLPPTRVTNLFLSSVFSLLVKSNIFLLNTSLFHGIDNISPVVIRMYLEFNFWLVDIRTYWTKWPQWYIGALCLGFVGLLATIRWLALLYALCKIVVLFRSVLFWPICSRNYSLIPFSSSITFWSFPKTSTPFF